MTELDKPETRRPGEVEARLAQQAAVAEVGLRALSGLPLPELADAIVARSAAVLGAEHGRFLELSANGDRLLLRAGVGWKNGCVGGATFPIARSLAGWVLETRQPSVVPDWAVETRFDEVPLLVEHGVRSSACVLVSTPSGPFGVLAVDSARARELTEHDLSFLQAMANVLGAAVARCRVEEALRHSLGATLSSIGDGAMSTDEQGRVVCMNGVAERLTGWTEGEARGRPLAEVFRIVNEDTRRPPQNPVDRVLREGRVIGLANHTALIARSGVERPIAGSGAPIHDALGKLAGADRLFRDLTEERKVETVLCESEERFRLLVERVQDVAIYLLDPEGCVTSWNDGAARIKGYSAEEVLGQSYAIFFTPEDRQAGVPGAHLAIAAREGAHETEAWRVRKDGTRFWANTLVTALRDDAGRLRGFAKVTRDFTARRKAEETARELAAQRAAREVAEAAEARLRASEERYRRQSELLALVLEGVADGVMAIDESGFVYANAAAARAFGYETGAALVKAPVGEVAERIALHDDLGAPVPIERLPPFLVLAGGQPGPALLHVSDRRTGATWWSLVTAKPVLDERGQPVMAVAIVRDVTEQRRREHAAEFTAAASGVLASGLDYTTTLERIANLAVPALADWCAVDLFDGDRRVSVAVAHADPTKVGMAHELQRRYPPDPMATRGAAHVARTGKSELYPDIADDALISTARDGEHLGMLRALGLRSAMIVPIVARGRTLGAMSLVASDPGRRFGPADLALAEDLARRAGMAIENATLYLEAKRAIHLRDEFLSIAGHELKTPLAALQLHIAGLVRLLRRGEIEPARVLERLEKAGNQGLRLERLIEQLLDVSRIQSGRLQLEAESLDLGALVAEVAERFVEAAASAGCALRLRLDEGVTGRWDRLRLDQVVTNLLTNAIKYGRGQPVEVVVAAGSDSAAVVEIRDHGIGIDEAHQERIFRRFERGVSDKSYGGFGLGLWISKEIVDAHGGTIRVTSRPGEGATFRVELPRNRGE